MRTFSYERAVDAASAIRLAEANQARYLIVASLDELAQAQGALS